MFRGLHAANRAQMTTIYLQEFLKVVDVYQTASGKAEATLSNAIFAQGQRLTLIRAGGADLSTRSLERAMQWLSDNWPETEPRTVWPRDVPRPTPHPPRVRRGADSVSRVI